MVESLGLAGSSGADGGFEERIRALLKSRKSALVHLTHNDLDAVGGDAVHRMRYGSITSIFCSVGSFPSALDAVASLEGNGTVLSISDLGYQRGIEHRIRRVNEAGWRIEWRDHHRWSPDEIGLVTGYCDRLILDTSTCGCGICARDLLPGDKQAAEIARVVCDYDLWKHEDPRSAVLGIVLQRKRNRDYVRDLLAEGILSDEYIEREYHDILGEMEEKMGRSIHKAMIMGEKYRIAFSPLYGYPSETAARMRKELATDIEVLISKDGRFSLRSVPPISHLIAREYGGGGHPNAAGGSFHFSFWDRIRFLLFGSSSQFSHFVEIAESIG
ncbi:MAG: phosphoesterase [Methanoregulaceae archaeon]|nr:phosphoesterase [Methanoregulaceae archaeon]